MSNRINSITARIAGELVDLSKLDAIIIEWDDGGCIELAPTTTEELQVYAYQDPPNPQRPNIGCSIRFGTNALFITPHRGDRHE